MMLVVEESHNFCPQVGQAASSKVFRTLASEGRKFGLGLVVITQRAAKVDKNVLSQCNTQIILKVTNPNDLKAIIASVEGLTTAMAEDFLGMARAYFADATHFLEQGELEKALANVNYAHGWLDAGARIGLFDVGADDQLFTLSE